MTKKELEEMKKQAEKDGLSVTEIEKESNIIELKYEDEK